ncbi:hypothetical protein [Isobaculum melis]|uniref:Uncharacterized protein n=1 Tax=Isobaculum melis TaxID=142588 RepID=A0A1H9S084_9LACT|nr:hypothetical protein [Isobaculum melis]SER78397.1 hypothetical protein SAMN04488559_1068 [Isobaculum melis]
MSRYNRNNRTATMCYLMIITQIIATLLALTPNLDILLASSTGLIYSFFFTKLMQAGINLFLLFRQQKYPTLIKSILIIFASVAIGTFNSSSHSWSAYYSYVDMLLVLLSVILLVIQIKYSYAGKK